MRKKVLTLLTVFLLVSVVTVLAMPKDSVKAADSLVWETVGVNPNAWSIDGNGVIHGQKHNNFMSNYYLTTTETALGNYWVTATFKGTLTNRNEETHLGFVPWYIDTNNYVLIYLVWSAGAPVHLTFRAVTDGALTSYTNHGSNPAMMTSQVFYKPDMTEYMPSDTIKVSIAKLRNGANDTDEFHVFVNDVGITALGYRDTVRYSMQQPKVGLYSYNDAFTVTNFGITTHSVATTESEQIGNPGYISGTSVPAYTTGAGNTWSSPSNGNYQVSTTIGKAAAILPNAYAANDYSISANVSASADSGTIGLYGNYTNEYVNTAYVVEGSGGSATAKIITRTTDYSTATRNILDTVTAVKPLSISLTEVTKLAVERVGNTYSFYVNDALVLSNTAALRGAGAGLYASTLSAAYFTDVFVQKLPTDLMVTGVRNGTTLNLSVLNGTADMKYQFWVREALPFDGVDIENGAAYIWSRYTDYSKTSTCSVTLTDNLRIDSSYYVFVRVSKTDAFVQDLYAVFSDYDVSQPDIFSVIVDGATGDGTKAVDINANTARILTVSNGLENSTYTLMYKDIEVDTSQTGEFELAVSGMECGLYDFTMLMQNGENTASYDFSVLLYGDYDDTTVAVIDAIVPTEDAGETTFTMPINAANGSAISQGDISNYGATLKFNGITLQGTIEVNAGVSQAVFITDYVFINGIYELSAQVFSYDGIVYDSIIYYYNKARTATVEIASDTAEIQTGSTVTLTASAVIDGSSENIMYAFYREDINGWTLIKNYTASGEDNFNKLVWQVGLAGTYRIQVRAKTADSGSYETARTYEYYVAWAAGGVEASDTLTAKVVDYNTGADVPSYTAGVPYKIIADYAGTTDVLYRFTVYNKNRGEVYLNTYTMANYIMFTANKYDAYIITVRVIAVGNGGYMDISVPITIVTT